MSTTADNLREQFLLDFDNPDDPILLNRSDLLEFLENYISKYEKIKHKRKPRIWKR